ncbi:MAG: OB-fold nucleic acid binding domain-containing protein, partial [Candidatus Promineifilaceae bacterium]
MSWEPTQLEQQRLEKVDRLREAGIDPYPLRSERTHTTAEALAAFEAAAEGEDVAVTVTGRLQSVRDMGKTVFAHISDEFGRIQLFLRRDEVGDESHQTFRKLIDLGDFIQATGSLMTTRSGDRPRTASAFCSA